MEGLYTRRNISECVGAAWTLLSTNLHRMAKSLWLPALLYSFSYALLAVASLNLIKDLSLGEGIALDMTAIAVLYIAGIAALLVVATKTFKQINTLDFKPCMSRTFKAFLVVAAFYILFVTLLSAISVGGAALMQSGKMSPVTTGIVMTILAIIVVCALFVFLSPFNYSLTKYMVEPETGMKQVWKNYRTGYRNLGFIVGCSLICLVIMATIYNVMALPGYIATISATQAYSGVANGDAANLPDYFPVIFGATMFVAGLVYTTLLVWFLFVEYYQYASIEARNGRTDSETEETDNANG